MCPENYFALVFLCALFLTRFHSLSEETLQEQHLLHDDPHAPGGRQRLHWHDHLQAKVSGASLWPISLQGHFPYRYRPIRDPDLLRVYCILKPKATETMMLLKGSVTGGDKVGL